MLSLLVACKAAGLNGGDAILLWLCRRGVEIETVVERAVEGLVRPAVANDVESGARMV